MMKEKLGLNAVLAGVEWRWSLLQFCVGLPAVFASFAIPAWAVSTTAAFERYAPATWVSAGFLGLLATSASYALATNAYAKRIRTKYDARMFASGGAIDPLEKTFERKRIYLNDFCLASHPLIENKSFIDCEIIGPANIVFVSGNSITQGKYPICDAVYLSEGTFPSNAYLFTDCVFRGCNFSRITYFIPYSETLMFKGYNLVKWITNSPYEKDDLSLTLPANLEEAADTN